jgi:outer membrane murein-binding lipoprotein Lpp
VTVDEKIERLAGIVETLAATVASHDDKIEAHDRQIDALIAFAEQQKEEIRQLVREWQAYLRTIRPQ